MEGWEAISYLFALAFGLDEGWDGMGSVYDCLLHRVVLCSCANGLRGAEKEGDCVWEEVL
jgi:hypothetical protein